MKIPSLLIALILMAGCASRYKPLRPDYAHYQNVANGPDGIDFAFRLGVLREQGNKKYAKREDKHAIRIASVRITNNLNRPIVVGNDLKFFSAQSELSLMEPAFVHKELKQGVPIYLLYFLLLDTTTPLGLIVGPGIALGNM